jgi:metal-responsive CopG/Arc/MetJ family transcriptional regulator
MKSKTSITLSQDLLAEIDRLAGPEGTRSALIERVLRAFVRRRQRHQADTRDLELLNRHASRLNAEAADVLTYQTSWPESAEG